MAKVPLPGRAKTRLVPALGADRAAALAAAMAADVLLTVAASGLPARVALDGPPDHPWARALPFPAEPQVGADLGERLTHALRDGGTAIGTDSPTLPAELLAEAASTGADVALSPAADGGYVLVHASAAAVRAGLFTGIPWSTADTFRAQLARAESLGLRARVLPAWYDVDEPADLAHLREHLASLPASTAPRTRAFLQDLDAAPHR